MENRVHEEIESVRHTLLTAHQREVDTQADLISMLKDKLARHEGNLLEGPGHYYDPDSSCDSPSGHVSGYSVATGVNSKASLVVLTNDKPTPPSVRLLK